MVGEKVEKWGRGRRGGGEEGRREKTKKERERYERRKGRGLQLVLVAAATAGGSGWRCLAVAQGGCKAADSGWQWLAAARGSCSNTRQRSSKAHVPPLSFSPFLFFCNYMVSFFSFFKWIHSSHPPLLLLNFFKVSVISALTTDI